MDVSGRVKRIGMSLRRPDPAPDDCSELLGTTMALPDEYVAFVREFDGAEGWIGDEYVAFWPSCSVKSYNDDLAVAELLPNAIVIATDGGNEAYALDLAAAPARVLKVPLIGMAREHAHVVGRDFATWLVSLSHEEELTSRDPPVTLGISVYFLNPVVLGGDPDDPSNRRLVPTSQVVAAAAWWNRRIRNV